MFVRNLLSSGFIRIFKWSFKCVQVLVLEVINLIEPIPEILVFIAFTSSEGNGKPTHLCRLAMAFTAYIYIVER